MASYIKRGESLFIPFKNGESIYDSQLKPRMYKTKDLYDRFSYHFAGAEMVEYAEVVRCKDCKHYEKCQSSLIGEVMCCTGQGSMRIQKAADDFCSYGERRGRMTLKRWNCKKRKYENYDIPDSWCVKTFVADLDTFVDCASCGNGVPFGLSYTSMEIHNAMGFGYAVCDECHEKEMKRRYGNAYCGGC